VASWRREAMAMPALVVDMGKHAATHGGAERIAQKLAAAGQQAGVAGW
jgi:hypothetical protein